MNYNFTDPKLWQMTWFSPLGGLWMISFCLNQGLRLIKYCLVWFYFQNVPFIGFRFQPMITRKNFETELSVTLSTIKQIMPFLPLSSSPSLPSQTHSRCFLVYSQWACVRVVNKKIIMWYVMWTNFNCNLPGFSFERVKPRTVYYPS